MEQGHHAHWGAEALWQQLEPLLPGLSIEVVARTDSTNTRLLERAREAAGQPDAPITRPNDLQAAGEADLQTSVLGRRSGDIQPCLLVAEYQTQGRGRLGRDWIGAAGASLCFSVALPLVPASWSGLSLAVGLALADALDAADPPRLMLKWPNDLWLTDSAGRGRKLGGILIETVPVGGNRMCVIGVGLNVEPLVAGSAVESLSHGYACLQELEPEATAPAVLARLAKPLVLALLAFERDGFAPLVARYARRDLLLGQSVVTNPSGSSGEPVQGVAEGVAEDGALRVRSGAVHHVVSGEVSVRLTAGQ
ncbi:MAG: biotin--[acetyl-CoA-carboxylase] ligase [Pseudomonadota bacterium]|nr:biotin--[acetyl-CoA-carboxylase] ligase [Pseudomonadota bacterium]